MIALHRNTTSHPVDLDDEQAGDDGPIPDGRILGPGEDALVNTRSTHNRHLIETGQLTRVQLPDPPDDPPKDQPVAAATSSSAPAEKKGR